MSKHIKQFRLALWLILATFLLWLLWQALVPSGQVTYDYDFSKINDAIGNLTPKDRVQEPSGGTQKIIGNPVYFKLRTARPFDQAKLAITYKNNSAATNIEAGVLVDNKLWRYDLQPVANSLIDQAISSKTWGLLESGDTMLLQKSEQYNSVSEFLAKLPAKDQVLLYNYDLATKYRLPNYQSASSTLVWSYPLRGGYQFYTYLKKENLAIDFNFTGLNTEKVISPVEVLVYNEANQVVTTQTLAPGQVTLNLNKSGLAEGVYKIEVKAADNVITKRISTKLSKLAFINHLWLAESEKPLSFFGAAGKLSLQTNNPASRGPVSVGNELIDLEETYRQIFTSANCGESCAIKLTKGDMVIAADGVFAPSAASLIDPRWHKLSAVSSIPAETKYILAKYTRPQSVGNYQQATVTFDLTRAYRKEGEYDLMLSIPGLSAEDESTDSLEITDIKVELVGKNWRQLLRRGSGQVIKLFKH